MSGDNSEEKTLPPSLKKLKDAREKGHVSHSSDMISAITVTTALIFIWVFAGSFIEDFKISAIQVQGLAGQPFQNAALDSTETLGRNIGVYAFSLAGALMVASILINLILLKGFLFTLEPIKPNFNNLNPIEGFKRIFSLRSLVELLKQILKSILIVSVCLFIALHGLNSAMRTPFCSLECVPIAFAAVVGPIIAATILIFLAAGAIDVLIQRWLFTRQLKMTKTEYKRERKDQEGTPEIRRAQRRVRHNLLQPKTNYTVSDATLLIEGGGTVVGLRYVRGETPLPLIVCKAKGQQAEAYLDIAAADNIPMFTDADLAAAMQRKIDVGGYITEEFFDNVAIAIQQAVRPR